MQYRFTDKANCVLLTGLMLAFLVAGCAVRFTEVRHGMTREDIMDRLGRPSLRTTDEQGRMQWIDFDVPLDENPRTDTVEGRRRLRLRLAEKNPAFFQSRPSNDKMTLFFSFDEEGNVADSRYMSRPTGTRLPHHR